MARKRSRATKLVLFAIGLICWGSPGPAAADKAINIAVIVHPKNTLDNISRADLARIFLRKTPEWRDGSRIMFFNSKIGRPVRTAFDRKVLHMSPEKAAAYWIDQRIRGKGNVPRTVNAFLVRRIVAAQRTAIAYVLASTVKKGVKVLRIDGRTPDDKNYLFKPARKK